MSSEFPIRINKFLAKCGHGSRRTVEDYILAGDVKVNGNIIDDLAYRVLESDSVIFKKKVCKLPDSSIFFAFNKPKNTLCSFKGEGGKATIYELLPAKFKTLHYIGRLDFKSHGLLLLTNNGDLTQKLLDPQNQIVRKYKVKVKPELKFEHKSQIEKGIKIDYKIRTKPAKIILKKKHFEIFLTEGKNREIRKMMENFNYKVIDLQRVSFGSIELGDLKLGKTRFLAKSEINSLISEIIPIK